MVAAWNPWILALLNVGRRRRRAPDAAERFRATPEPPPASPTPAAAPRCLRCSAEAPDGAALCARCAAQTENPGGFVLVVLHPREAKISKVGWVSDEHLLVLISACRRNGAKKELTEFVWILDHGGVDALLLELRGAGLSVAVRCAEDERRAAALLKMLVSMAPLGGSVRAGNDLLIRQLKITDRQIRRLLGQLIERRQLHRCFRGGDRVLTPYPDGDAPPSEDQEGRTSPLGRTSASGRGGRQRPGGADVDVRPISFHEPVMAGQRAPGPGPGGPQVVLGAAAPACPAAAPAGRDGHQLPLAVVPAPSPRASEVVLLAAARAGAAPSAAAQEGGADVASAVENSDVRPEREFSVGGADVTPEADVRPAASPPLQVVLGAAAPACPAAAPAGRDKQLAQGSAPAPAPPEQEVLLATARAGAAPSARAQDTPRLRPLPPQRRRLGRDPGGAPPPPIPPGPPLWTTVLKQLLERGGGSTAALLMRVVQCQAAEGGRLVLCAPGADEHFPASVQRLYGAQLCALAEAQTGEPYRLEWVAAREEGDHRASA